MIGRLPQALEVKGRLLPIRTDFRDILAQFEMLNDDELSDVEKAYVCCRNLYKSEITPADFEEATNQLYRFIDGGDIPKSEPSAAKIIDWEKDERIIMPAISKTVGVADVRELPYMHWWTFLGAFGEISEGMLSTVLSLRRKQADGEKLEKWEQKYIRKNRDLIEIRTREEQAAIDETEAFVKELLHET